MMVKDALGNTLLAGHLVLWNNLICKVREVHDTSVLMARGKEVTQNVPRVVIELAVQLQPNEPSPFVRVVDPASDALVDSLVAGVS